MAKKSTPRPLFEIYESLHFFYESQNAGNFKEIAPIMKANLEISLETKMLGLVQDITILMSGDISNPRYSMAFERWLEHYRSFSYSDLSNYLGFLCSTFNVILPENHVKTPITAKYEPLPEISGLIIRKEKEKLLV